MTWGVRCRSRSPSWRSDRHYAQVVENPDVAEWPFQRGNDSGTGVLLISTLVTTGLAIFGHDDSGNGINWHLFFEVLAVGLAIGTYRYWKVEFRAGPSGVVVRNPLRNRAFAWDEMAKFESASSMSAGPGSAIGVVRHDGWRMTAMAGSRLSDSEVARDVEWLNRYMENRRSS